MEVEEREALIGRFQKSDRRYKGGLEVKRDFIAFIKISMSSFPFSIVIEKEHSNIDVERRCL